MSGRKGIQNNERMAEMSENAGEFVLAYCGLVCSGCGMFLKNKCQGCHSDKPMYRNCKVRRCAITQEYSSCAECKDFENLKECEKLYNLISRLFGFIFRTSRIANLERIREIGFDKFKEEICEKAG